MLKVTGPVTEPIRSGTTTVPRPSASVAPQVGTAVIGMGYWGPNLLRVVADNLDAEVRWICDLDRERLERYQPRHPGAQITTRFDRVLADPAVSAVIIATPAHTHYQLAARALEAGKHVFVEKPLAPCSELADELAEMAQARQRILMCGHTFLYSPPVRAIKRMIAEGRLGDIYCLSSSRVNAAGRPPEVSVIADLGPHDFSILLYWLSEMPLAVRAIGRDATVRGIPDVAYVTMTFASGVVANVELSRLAPARLRRTVVVGSERMALYDDGAVEPVRLFERSVTPDPAQTFGEYRLSARAGDVITPRIESDEPLALEMGDFISAIGVGSRMEFHTAIARSVVRIVEAAERSLSQGGHEVSLRHDEVVGQLARPALAAL